MLIPKGSKLRPEAAQSEKSRICRPSGARESIGRGNYKYAAPKELPNTTNMSKNELWRDICPPRGQFSREDVKSLVSD
jgi:hypothetical protein